MTLKPGRYHIEVSHTGYKYHTEWITLENKDLTYSVVLEEKQQAAKISKPTVEARPPNKNYRGIDMVSVPAGCFQMGGDYSHEKPIHRVYLSAYEIGKYEVT